MSYISGGGNTPIVSTETYSPSMALNWTSKDEIIITLSGNLDITNMSGGTHGKRYVLTLKQDSTGNRVLTISASQVRYSDDIVSVNLSTVASRIDRLGFIYNSTDGKFDIVAINKGFH